MSYTMQDFRIDYAIEHFNDLTEEEKAQVLQSVPIEVRLAGASKEQIQQYLNKLIPETPTKPRKPRGRRS